MASTKVGLWVSVRIKTRYTASFIDKAHRLRSFSMWLINKLFRFFLQKS
jgi:hypothetical protein